MLATQINETEIKTHKKPLILFMRKRTQVNLFVLFRSLEKQNRTEHRLNLNYDFHRIFMLKIEEIALSSYFMHSHMRAHACTHKTAIIIIIKMSFKMFGQFHGVDKNKKPEYKKNSTIRWTKDT